MSKLIDMQNKRADLAKQMRNLVDSVDSAKGMTPEQETQWNAMDKDIQALDKGIRAIEAQLELENRLGDYDPVRRPAPQNDSDGGRPHASAEYQRDFEQFVRSRDISADARGNLLRVSNALNTGTDTEGGFIVPEAWEATLIAALSATVLMRQIATVRSTSSTISLPIVDDKGAAGWVDELAAYPESDISFASKKLEAWKLGRIMKVSEEILEDSFLSLDQEIASIFAECFGEAEDIGFFTGNGTKKPRGAILDAAVGVTAASNTAITYDEIVSLVYSVKERIRMKSTMVMADATAGMLRKLKSADGVPLWQPSIQAGQPDMMLGRPLRTADAMPVVAASASPILFGDFSYYRIADRGGIYMQRLNEKYADEGAVGFRMRKRVDGKLTRSDAVKRLVLPA